MYVKYKMQLNSLCVLIFTREANKIIQLKVARASGVAMQLACNLEI